MPGCGETFSLRLLLDTEAVLRLDSLGLESLGSRSRKLITDPDNDLLLSTVSMTEMAIKSAIGKLAVTAELLPLMMQDLRLIALPFETRHATRLFDLPLHHRDPFDRMLIATALVEGCPIISSDRQFKNYKGLQVIW